MHQEAMKLLDAGQTIHEACQEIGISVATFHRWRRKFGKVATAATPAAKPYLPSVPRDRWQRLEWENKRLKILVAELSLENAFLKDILEGSDKGTLRKKTARLPIHP